MKYFEEAKMIWKTRVPRSGQAKTVEGELLRGVEKLRDESLRNGNCNWDRGFEIILDFLESHLLDPEVYPAKTIQKTTTTLKRLRDFKSPYLKDDLFDQLGDRVVEYFKFHGSQSHKKNPNLHR